MGKRDPHMESSVGPSYWDIEEQVRWVRSTLAGDVFWEISAHHITSENEVRWWVIAKIRRWTGPKRVEWWNGGYQFRGNAGAKTMPAAMHMALGLAIDKAEAAKALAERQSTF